ncbi:MAG: hypothetical protein R3C56_20215 [Pirellulaceae bacterium]
MVRGGYLRKNFHAVAVNREHLLAVMRAEGESIGPDDALVIFANHASWWDPLTAILLLSDSLATTSCTLP